MIEESIVEEFGTHEETSFTGWVLHSSIYLILCVLIVLLISRISLFLEDGLDLLLGIGVLTILGILLFSVIISSIQYILYFYLLGSIRTVAIDTSIPELLKTSFTHFPNISPNSDISEDELLKSEMLFDEKSQKVICEFVTEKRVGQVILEPQDLFVDSMSPEKISAGKPKVYESCDLCGEHGYHILNNIAKKSPDADHPKVAICPNCLEKMVFPVPDPLLERLKPYAISCVV